MVFKLFRTGLIFRILILALSIFGFTWLLLQTSYYISMFTLSCIIFIQVGMLIRYTERTNVAYSKFLDSIEYDDFSQTYTSRGLGQSFDNLNTQFNRVIQKFQEVRAEKEAQYHYLKTIVQHIDIGLLVLDDTGSVQLINSAAQKLLNINHLSHIKQLRDTHQPLVQLIAQENSISDKTREVVKLTMNEEIAHLIVRATNITLRSKQFKIVSLQDIQSELEEKEMEAWQNLIRVLTHEIINSVTPIASLSATVHEDLEYYKKEIEEHQQGTQEEKIRLPADYFTESLEDVHQAVRTIQRRSEGLIHFVRDFRNLTKIPLPDLQTLSVKELFESINTLLKEEMKQQGIRFSCQTYPKNLQLIADPHLLEQVLINLLKNATHAVEDKEDKQISLIASTDKVGKVVIKVYDNGTGIGEEAKKKVFIPLFTTKKNGSGIGLSLSRQVMRLHGGTINVNSTPQVETVFTLRFA
ncbi:sensor histidine kinase [Microscilla marina]|uniref:histidine kinase n=1 Tax=Microscilla marina ATCC 23134 TaxID=313606 RepID=A1ZYD5_MICM2|nr:ATP-binding protein [Microscilla marina]EAY24608.1 sensory box sensor histidine kinase [Microscilla marina ATCC 23134]